VPSGGYALESDFGTFYAPNITPDVETGIGNWTGADFLAALKHGRTPEGSFYYPAFPYRSYAGLADEDVLDMAAYIMSLSPVSYQEPEPDLVPWLQRPMVAGWNLLADFSQPEPEVFEDELLARGAYLARNLAHCGECHTPRNGLGIPDWSREFAGAELGEEVIEAIDGEALEEWTFANFDLFLILGMKPEGEFVGGDMNEVIEFNTSNLTDEDRDAMAAFFTRHHAGD
jgi:mono/diheme cytochrome c family protein